MLIGCYYYPWYSGQWLCRTVRGGDPPTLGEYNNRSYGPSVDAHMKMAKEAGVDFMAVSWEPGNDYGYVLDAAASHGIKITCLYESLRRASKMHDIQVCDHESVLDDLKMIADDMSEECWLRMGSRPVLMIYVTRCYRTEAESLFNKARELIPGVFIVGDELFWSDVPAERLVMFDAVTAYNMYHPVRAASHQAYLDDCRSRMLEHAWRCREVGVPLWGNAMPGYNDMGVRPEKKHPPLPRLDGEFFRKSIADAKEAMNVQCLSDKVLMITSMSEWYEDTQIEPAISYGNLYLNMLQRLKTECS
jgi:hypothetical protein